MSGKLLTDAQRAALATRLRRGREAAAEPDPAPPARPVRPAAVLRPGTAVVHRPVRARPADLQHPARPAAVRPAGRSRPGPGPDRPGGPARGAAHPAGHRGQRPPRAGHRPARGRGAGPARPLGAGAGTAAGRAARVHRRRGGAAVRPGRRAAAADLAGPAGCAGGAGAGAVASCQQSEHVLLIVVHHTVFDGWSAGVLVRDLAALYQAEVTGEPAALPELPVQFADYALWERDRLHGARAGRAGGLLARGAGRVRDHPVPHRPAPPGAGHLRRRASPSG